MTSETLRKLLVAGAAVAALSVAACGQPAENTETVNTTENTTVTEVAPAVDANATAPVDANAVAPDANATVTTTENTTSTTNTTAH
jgi:hypothetical protein